MRWNVVEIAHNGRYVKLFRGFLLVMKGDEELGRVVIDELNCLLLTAEQATLSKPVMVRLAEEGVPIIVCGRNYHPLSFCLPYGTHYQVNAVMKAQIAASVPLKKRLWQALVREKIRQQRNMVLHYCLLENGAVKRLERMVKKVRSGDPDNIEAQAARLYWQTLFGAKFRRRAAQSDFANRALNYGYSILRAACARAVVAAGLAPALGLHHSNVSNPFCLVDDLMEIYRPLVDEVVLKMTLSQLNAADAGKSSAKQDLEPEQKAKLSRLLQRDVWVEGQLTTLATSMQTLAFSLVESYKEKQLCWKMPSFTGEGMESFGTASGEANGMDELEH